MSSSLPGRWVVMLTVSPAFRSDTGARPTPRPTAMRRIRASVLELVKDAFRTVGLDVHRWKRSPKYTLLGLRSMPIRSIVDVGANEGQFAKWIMGIFPGAKLYAFEPLPGPYEKLAAWARSQGGSVRTFNLALGDVTK